jgi:hypothetical protein
VPTTEGKQAPERGDMTATAQCWPRRPGLHFRLRSAPGCAAQGKRR